MLPGGVQGKPVCVGCDGKIAQEWCILIKNDLAAVQGSGFVLELRAMCATTGKGFACVLVCHLTPLALECRRSLTSPSFGSGSMFSDNLAVTHDFTAEKGTLWMSVQESSSAKMGLLVVLSPFTAGQGGRAEMLHPL